MKASAQKELNERALSKKGGFGLGTQGAMMGGTKAKAPKSNPYNKKGK